jgi:hypothetical protein
MSNNKGLPTIKKKLSARVDEDIVLYFQRKAILEDRSISWLVNKALRTFIQTKSQNQEFFDFIDDFDADK